MIVATIWWINQVIVISVSPLVRCRNSCIFQMLSDVVEERLRESLAILRRNVHV